MGSHLFCNYIQAFFYNILPRIYAQKKLENDPLFLPS